MGQTNGHLIASFPFLRDVLTIATIAQIIGRPDINKDYMALYATLAKEFHATFWSNNTSIGYANGYQTANSLALGKNDIHNNNLTTPHNQFSG